ncbi:MAG: hypothetical protein EP343_01975 [Deltaproteobacteria bacterium]|nr:MAG: hypothetical protein EP343_01975 [Deltaproteobacteria bacterium]
MKEPRWNTEQVLAQLRLRLIQEGGTTRLLKFLSHDGFSAVLFDTLERCAHLPSEDAALQNIQQWLQQQQHQRQYLQEGQPLPAIRMWNFLKPLLGDSHTQQTQAGSQRSYNTPLPRSVQTSHTPLPSNTRPAHRPAPHTPQSRMGSTPHTPRSTNRTPQPRVPSNNRTPQPGKPYPNTPLPSNVQRPSQQVSTKRHSPGSTRHSIPQIREVQAPASRTGQTGMHPRINRPPPQAPIHTPLPQEPTPSQEPMEPFQLPDAVPAAELQTPPGMPSLRRHRSRRSRLRKSQPAPPRGLPSSPSLSALPAVGHSPLEDPHWQVDAVINQLRVKLLKDKTLASLRRYLTEDSFQQQLLGTLETAASLPTLAAAKENVRSWLLQQQARMQQGFPGQRFWNFLEPLLNEASSKQDSPSSASVAPTTPLPVKPERNNPLLPRHKQSLRRRRSSTSLPAAQSITPAPKPPATKPLESSPPVEEPAPKGKPMGLEHLSTLAEQPQAGEANPSPKPRVRGAHTSSTGRGPQPSEPSRPPRSPQEPKTPIESSSKRPQRVETSHKPSQPAQEETASQLDRMIENMQLMTEVHDKDLQNMLELSEEESHSSTTFQLPQDDIEQAERKRTQRLLVLFALSMLAAFLFWNANREPGADLSGKKLETKTYSAYLPVAEAYGKNKRIAFVLKRKWQEKYNPDQLAQQIFRMRSKLQQSNFTRVHVYTPSYKLLYSINLVVRF